MKARRSQKKGDFNDITESVRRCIFIKCNRAQDWGESPSTCQPVRNPQLSSFYVYMTKWAFNMRADNRNSSLTLTTTSRRAVCIKDRPNFKKNLNEHQAVTGEAPPVLLGSPAVITGAMMEPTHFSLEMTLKCYRRQKTSFNKTRGRAAQQCSWCHFLKHSFYLFILEFSTICHYQVLHFTFNTLPLKWKAPSQVKYDGLAHNSVKQGWITSRIKLCKLVQSL